MVVTDLEGIGFLEPLTGDIGACLVFEAQSISVQTFDLTHNFGVQRFCNVLDGHGAARFDLHDDFVVDALGVKDDDLPGQFNFLCRTGCTRGIDEQFGDVLPTPADQGVIQFSHDPTQGFPHGKVGKPRRDAACLQTRLHKHIPPHPFSHQLERISKRHPSQVGCQCLLFTTQGHFGAEQRRTWQNQQNSRHANQSQLTHPRVFLFAYHVPHDNTGNLTELFRKCNLQNAVKFRG